MVYSLFQKSAYFLAGNKMLSYYREMQKNNDLCHAEILALQEKSLNKLIEYAYTNSRYYHALLDKCHIRPAEIRTANDLWRLAPLTKKVCRQNLEQIRTSDHHGKRAKLCSSSGTSGIKTLYYKSPYYEQVSRGVLLRACALMGYQPHDKSAWFWSDPAKGKPISERLISRLGYSLNRTLLIDTQTISIKNFPQIFHKMERFKPTVIFGNARIIAEFAKFLLAHSCSLTGVKSVICTVETLLDRSSSQAAFQCPVHNLYSTRECYGAAFEQETGSLNVAEDAYIMNLNKHGKIFITALYSYGFPLINYEIGDIAIVHQPHNDAPAKTPFRKILIKTGRTTDLFFRENQEPVFVQAALSSFFKTAELNVIGQQFVQTGYTSFIVNFVPDTGWTAQYYENITQALQQHFGEKCSIIFNRVDAIPLEKSGKQLLFKRTFLLEEER